MSKRIPPEGFASWWRELRRPGGWKNLGPGKALATFWDGLNLPEVWKKRVLIMALPTILVMAVAVFFLVSDLLGGNRRTALVEGASRGLPAQNNMVNRSPGNPAAAPAPAKVVAKIKPAIPVFQFKPRFPACGQGNTEVQMYIVVEPDGSINDVDIISATTPCFAEAAVKTVRSWQYKPQIENGVPVRSNQMFMTLRFEKDD